MSNTGRPGETFSVITATYNRAHLLPRLFDSLVAQDVPPEYWIVVDDGSTDGTLELVRAWQARPTLPFTLHYLTQENAGKHVALNQAIQQAPTQYCYFVDSDDWLPAHSIADLKRWAHSVAGRDDIAGIAGTKVFGDGSPLGPLPLIPKDSFLEITNLERHRFRLMGDVASEAYKTSVIKQFPYPVFPGEKFMQEAYVFNAIAAAGYQLRWHHTPIYHCEYQAKGLSALALRHQVESFQGFCVYVRQTLDLTSGLRHPRILRTYSAVARTKGLDTKDAARLIGVRWSTLAPWWWAKRVKDSLLMRSVPPRSGE